MRSFSEGKINLQGIGSKVADNHILSDLNLMQSRLCLCTTYISSFRNKFHRKGNCLFRCFLFVREEFIVKTSLTLSRREGMG